MTEIEALLFADDRPTFVVDALGSIIASNPATCRIVGILPAGANLASVCSSPPHEVAAYLSRCARTRGPVPGSLWLIGQNRQPARFRFDGGVVKPAETGRLAQIILRVRSPADAHESFIALQQQIQALHRELSKSEVLKAQLEEALVAKQVLLDEVHHRVKNNMQVVVSMLSMAVGSNDPGAALQQAILRVRSIGVIQKLLYETDHIQDVNCGDLIRDVVAGVRAVHGRNGVKIDISCHDISLDANRAVSLALIVTELVTNAFKHAFSGREAGSLRIVLSSADRECTLAVIDDGNPFPTSHGVGTGIRITQSLAQDLGGKFEIRTAPYKSATVLFQLA